MKIEMIAIDRLVPYARNARRHSEDQVAKVAGSIREFGFTNPVLIDKHGGIIAGHCRVLAARQLGIPELPCIRLGHLTEQQKRAYVIADNRLAEIGGGWDIEMLAREIEGLRLDDVSLDLIGFADADLDEMFEKAFAVGAADMADSLDDADGVDPDDVTVPAAGAKEEGAGGLTYPVLVTLTRPAHLRLKELRKQRGESASDVVCRLILDCDAMP